MHSTPRMRFRMTEHRTPLFLSFSDGKVSTCARSLSLSLPRRGVAYVQRVSFRHRVGVCIRIEAAGLVQVPRGGGAACVRETDSERIVPLRFSKSASARGARESSTVALPDIYQMATNNTEEIEEIEKKEQETPNPEEFPPELLIKHPLQNTWTLWYYEPDKNRSWEDSQREITSFDTAEDFWSLYNHIKMASELRQGCDYSMFKQGIRPMWEDDANQNGGRWVINLDKRQRTTDLDNFWLEILLCMIGEGFNEYSDDINGAVVNIRPKIDKLAVWTGDASTQSSVMEIGRKLKERLRMSPKIQIAYQAHRDTMVKVGSMAKTTYVI